MRTLALALLLSTRAALAQGVLLPFAFEDGGVARQTSGSSSFGPQSPGHRGARALRYEQPSAVAANGSRLHAFFEFAPVSVAQPLYLRTWAKAATTSTGILTFGGVIPGEQPDGGMLTAHLFGWALQPDGQSQLNVIVDNTSALGPSRVPLAPGWHLLELAGRQVGVDGQGRTRWHTEWSIDGVVQAPLEQTLTELPPLSTVRRLRLGSEFDSAFAGTLDLDDWRVSTGAPATRLVAQASASVGAGGCLVVSAALGSSLSDAGASAPVAMPLRLVLGDGGV
ncbi:MAG: hypothetical protein K1X89_31585, partial [Myxococcaceae bacterium]|nr:hypothetical protein [Myxococcaceae bacterium]